MAKVRPLFVALGLAVVQGQIGFEILIRARDPVWFLAIFVVALQASLLLQGFEQAFWCWLPSLLLSLSFVILFLPLPAFLGVLPLDVAFTIIGASLSRVLVSVLVIIAPIGFLGCFIGQMLRSMLL